jgi:hypothetical protein
MSKESVNKFIFINSTVLKDTYRSRELFSNIKTTGEQLSILCHNGTIYLTNPGKKLDWPSKDTLESEGILIIPTM